MNLKNSIKTRLITMFLLVGLIPALVIALIFYVQIDSTERLALERDSIGIVNSIDNVLGGYLAQRQSEAETLAGDNNISLPVSLMEFSQPESSTWRTALNTLRNSINRVAPNFEDNISDIFVTSGTNIIYNQQATLLDQTSLDFISSSFENNEPVWSSWVWSNNLQSYLAFITVPLKDTTGTAIGTIGLGVSEADFNNTLHSFTSPNGLDYNAYLIGFDGNLLSSSSDQSLALLEQFDAPILPLVSATLTEEDEIIPTVSAQYDTHNETNVLGYAKLTSLGDVPAAIVIETLSSTAFANITRVQWITIIALIICAALITLVSTLMVMTITKPISQLVTFTEQAASGDLSSQMENKHTDEFGKLINAFNQMVQNLREMISAIQDVVNSASASSQQLSAASEENSATIQEIVVSINKFAEVTKDVNEISQTMSKQAQNVQQLSVNGTKQMSESSNAMAGILDSSQSSQQHITELERSTDEINHVIKIISEVAEQTNLLALNAAIEAARAGEHGRGFAVVADEVRKLAEQTQDSVGVIMGYIDALRTGTHQSVRVINENNNQIEVGAKSLEHTKTDFDSISNSIRETVRLINQVTDAGKELDHGMAEIAASSEEQAASMEQIAASAEAVAKMADEMSNLINNFKI